MVFTLNRPPEFFAKNRPEFAPYANRIGDYTYAGGSILIMGNKDGKTADLAIGKFCSIGPAVSFLFLNHRTEWVTTYPLSRIFNIPGVFGGDSFVTKGPIIVGNDVYIGEGATLLAGIEVGHGAVIGAHAVVSRSVLPYEIVAGNPARPIKKRFDDATITDLLEVRWWDLPI